MLLAARDNRGNEAAFRKRILDYLQEGDVAPIIESLTDARVFRLEDWITQIAQIRTLDEAQEWRGSTARLLSSFPEQPGLLIARGYSELALPDGDFDEAQRNLTEGFRSARDNYASSESDLAQAANTLTMAQLSGSRPAASLAIATCAQDYIPQIDHDGLVTAIESSAPDLPGLGVLRLGGNLDALLKLCDELFTRETV